MRRHRYIFVRNKKFVLKLDVKTSCRSWKGLKIVVGSIIESIKETNWFSLCEYVIDKITILEAPICLKSKQNKGGQLLVLFLFVGNFCSFPVID